LLEELGGGVGGEGRRRSAEFACSLPDCGLVGVDVHEPDDVGHLGRGVADDRAAVGVADE